MMLDCFGTGYDERMCCLFCLALTSQDVLASSFFLIAERHFCGNALLHC